MDSKRKLEDLHTKVKAPGSKVLNLRRCVEEKGGEEKERRRPCCLSYSSVEIRHRADKLRAGVGDSEMEN